MAISGISGASALLANPNIKKKTENIAQEMAIPAAAAATPNIPTQGTANVFTKDATAKTKFTAQDMAQKMAKANEEVMREFMELAKKSPAERIRDQILKSKGLTEEDVQAMKPEEREALEKEIARMIKDKIEEGVKRAMVNPQAGIQPISQAQQAAPNYENVKQEAEQLTTVEKRKEEELAYLKQAFVAVQAED